MSVDVAFEVVKLWCGLMSSFNDLNLINLL